MTEIPDGTLTRWGRLGSIDPTEVFDALDEGVLVQSAAGRILAVNDAASRLLGLPLDLLTGGDKTVLEGPILREDGTPLPRDEMPGRRAILTGVPQLGVVFGLTNRGGSIMWVEINCRPLFEGPDVVAVVSSLRDVTEKRRVEHALRDAERRQRMLLEHAVGGYVVVGPDGRVLSGSRSFHDSLEPEPDRVVDYQNVHPDDRDLAVALIQQAMAAPGQPRRAELRASGAAGIEQWVELTATDHRDDELIGGVVINFTDITERKQAEAALAYQAGHDVVTGLPNRRLLTERLDAALTAGSKVGVVFFDVDHFKLVNDSLGHPAGDGILDEVARRLRSGARPGDTVSRFGGDEFVVICDPVLDVEEVLGVAHSLADLIDAPFDVERSERSVTVSAGVTISTRRSTSADLLREADTALNLAKDLGRDRIEVFTDEIQARATRQLTLETELRRALERAELHVVYQPIVDVTTAAAVGCEALLRWNHPELGPISPVEFIPIAERTGVIAPIGEWVIHQAVQQLARWAGDAATPSDFWVSVNVSAIQLARGDLVDRVAVALASGGVDASRLHLEITEGVLMDDIHSSIEQLGALRDLGVRIDVDDFGTGYSSLAYLKRLPITTLKIDRSFVDGLGTDPQDTSIVRAIIRLGHALDLDLVAEGVETATQLAELRELGCTHAQGYLWLPPRPPEDVESWLATSEPPHAGGDAADRTSG